MILQHWWQRSLWKLKRLRPRKGWRRNQSVVQIRRESHSWLVICTRWCRRHRNRRRLPWRCFRLDNFLVLDWFCPSDFDLCAVDFGIFVRKGTWNYTTNAKREWRLTIHGAHCFLGFFSGREMNEGEIAHHLQLLDIIIRDSVENVAQYLLCGREWQISHVQDSNLAYILTHKHDKANRK